MRCLSIKPELKNLKCEWVMSVEIKFECWVWTLNTECFLYEVQSIICCWGLSSKSDLIQIMIPPGCEAEIIFTWNVIHHLYIRSLSDECRIWPREYKYWPHQVVEQKVLLYEDNPTSVCSKSQAEHWVLSTESKIWVLSLIWRIQTMIPPGYGA